MATITGQGTTYGLPNYHGELFTVTPTETPFLSAIGGLQGAKKTTATQFEWQTVDRRTSTSNNVALEGANAPTAAERSRSNVTNVVEIHQSAIELSYTRLAASGNFAGANIAPEMDDATIDELTLQTTAELQSMAVDIEQSFLNGVYQKPANNSTARQTRGLLTAISTNAVVGPVSVGTATVVAATGVWTTSAAHGCVVGDAVELGPITTTTGVSARTRYYVITQGAANTFVLSATKGGSGLTLTGDGSTSAVYKSATVTKANIDNLLSTAFANGAKLTTDTTVLMVGPGQKVGLSNTYSTATLNQPTFTRNIGGVAMDTLITDFGVYPIMLNRWMPAGYIGLVDLSVCYPVFLEIPGKGLLFAEELGRVGAARKFQLYGEIGLEYGPETFHGVLTGLL